MTESRDAGGRYRAGVTDSDHTTPISAEALEGLHAEANGADPEPKRPDGRAAGAVEPRERADRDRPDRPERLDRGSLGRSVAPQSPPVPTGPPSSPTAVPPPPAGREPGLGSAPAYGRSEPARNGQSGY